jgi:hypothetical protein
MVVKAKELLTITDCSTLKGKRDYAILALLAGCALFAGRELTTLDAGKAGLPKGILIGIAGSKVSLKLFT